MADGIGDGLVYEENGHVVAVGKVLERVLDRRQGGLCRGRGGEAAGGELNDP